MKDTLLHSAIPTDDGKGRWAYPLWGKLLISAFILFDATILLVWALPGKGLAHDLHKYFNEHLEMTHYLQATGTRQSWAMFAPNPNRTNTFMRVLLEDEDGEVWDLQHDIYGVNRYPYLWYDRMGKINRRIARTAGYRRYYAAWVCRNYEREHGVLPEEIRFVKKTTRIPTPQKLWKMTRGRPWLGYDPWKLPTRQSEDGSFNCATTPHAQLPDSLRERFGMEPAEKGHFKPVHLRTWVQRQEQERLKKEREQRRAERAALREEKQAQRAAAMAKPPADEPDEPVEDDAEGEGD